MGKVLRSGNTDEKALGRALAALYARINSLENRKANVPVVSGTSAAFTLSDGDGGVWIDRDDHSLHFRCSGQEFKIVGTLV